MTTKSECQYPDILADLIHIPDGIYILWPEGSGWISLDIRDGRIVRRSSEDVAGTYDTARDPRADLVPRVDDEECGWEVAEAVVGLYDADWDPETVPVYRRRQASAGALAQSEGGAQ